MHSSSHPSTHLDNAQYSRKRQREQTAAIVVKSLGSRNLGRKSTAQPRPVLYVPPRGIGPTIHPNVNDVLCGRGGRINSHSGNIQFREITASLKKEYLAKTTKKLEKAHIAAKIIYEIRSMEPPGRFLKEDSDTGLWFDIGDAKAIKKAGQSLREDAPDIRHEIDGDSYGDDNDSSGNGNKESPAKKSEDSAKAPTLTKKKSDSTPDLQAEPKKSTASASSLTRRQSSQTSPRQGQGFVVSGRGPQHLLPNRIGSWVQQGNGAYLATTPHNYQSHLSMSPPYSHQVHSYNVDDQSFQAQIPTQAPHPSQSHALPKQLYSGARSSRQRFASASRDATGALKKVLPSWGQYPHDHRRPDGIAFGRQFHPPSGIVLSPNNTRKTISALSVPLLSGIRVETGRGIVGHPMPSPGGAQTVSQLNMTADSTRARPSHLQSSSMSDLTGGSHRSIGRESLQRSLSFPDMNSINFIPPTPPD